MVHQEIVTVHPQPADGWFRPQSGVWPVPVVHVDPRGEVGGALVRGLVGPGVGPFLHGRLDEALGLAVGPRRAEYGHDFVAVDRNRRMPVECDGLNLIVYPAGCLALIAPQDHYSLVILVYSRKHTTIIGLQ